MAKTSHPWHPADIYAAIRKKGESLASIARGADPKLEPSTVRKALYEPGFSGEQAIARTLGIEAHKIWPDRYDEEGIPLHPRARAFLLNIPKGITSSKNDKVA